MENALNSQTLTLPRERTCFLILAIFSAGVWLVCVVTIFPIVGLLIGGFIAWLAHGLLIARIKSEAIKVDGNQLPELANSFAAVCADLQLPKIPDLYVMQAGGLLNAFATRFASRDFVVVYSDLLEAYGPDSGEIKFLLGHEIGHVRSRHVLKNMLLIPGLFLPLIGSAYNRACESSCDRHGALASRDADASVRAMMILSGGKNVGKTLAPSAFSTQHFSARGFFVSLHELFSSYPTLSKRVSDLLDLKEGRQVKRPARSALAYLLALFCPGARYGILGTALTIYLVAIFAGIALPAFTTAKRRAQMAAQHRAAVQQYQEPGLAPSH